MDMQQFLTNRQQFPPGELAKHAGKYIAWSPDGTRILASDDDLEKVAAAVEDQGYDSSEIVLSSVPFPDEVVLGGEPSLQRIARGEDPLSPRPGNCPASLARWRPDPTPPCHGGPDHRAGSRLAARRAAGHRLGRHRLRGQDRSPDWGRPQPSRGARTRHRWTSQPVRCRYARVQLRITDGLVETYEWTAVVGFVPTRLRYALIGYAGFLKYFDAEFRGDDLAGPSQPQSLLPRRAYLRDRCLG